MAEDGWAQWATCSQAACEKVNKILQNITNEVWRQTRSQFQFDIVQIQIFLLDWLENRDKRMNFDKWCQLHIDIEHSMEMKQKQWL